MDTFRGHTSLSRRLRNAVVAIGNFDGVHHGHAQIFDEARSRARDLQGESVVLTFDPHPAKVLAPAVLCLLATFAGTEASHAPRGHL